MTPLDAMPIEPLREAAKLLDRENNRLIQENIRLQRELVKLKGGDLQQRMEQLEQQLAAMRQDKFGDSTEKRPAPPASEPKPKKPRTGHGPNEQARLDRVDEIHQLDEADKACTQCGGALAEWAGQFEESEEVDIIPRRYIVRRHLRQKYRCACGGCVETALGVPKLISGGRYSPDFAVDVAVSKYLDHMPLERQVRAMARDGLIVDSNTLWDQINALAKHLAPLHDRLHAFVLSHGVIGADETHWKFLAKNGGAQEQKRWQAWVAAAPQAVSYRITPSRDSAAAREVLKGFGGVVMVDGYGVYEHAASREGFVVANCWAHVRRKFFELENVIAAATREEILALIGGMYHIEKSVDRAGLAEARHTRTRAIVADIRAWLLKHKARELPRGAFAKAIDYALERWTGLTRFLDDVRIPLDNNASERALRGLVVGRKNHYGSKSERGTRVAALLYSLCESAKLADIDPRVYLRGAIWQTLRGEEVWLPHEVRARAAAGELPQVDG